MTSTDEASSWAEMALRENPTLNSASRIAAATNAVAGRLEQAQNEMIRLKWGASRYACFIRARRSRLGLRDAPCFIVRDKNRLQTLAKSSSHER
jgi:hypothetical protein